MADLRSLEDRLDRLESRSRNNFFEIEKKLNKLDELGKPQPQAELEERIQELEDLVMLLELENTKIKEKLSIEPLLEEPAATGDMDSRLRTLEEKISRLGDREPMEKGKIDPKVIEKISKFEDRIAAIAEIGDKVVELEDRLNRVAKEKGIAKEDHALNVASDVDSIKRELEELRRSGFSRDKEEKFLKDVTKKVEELEYDVRDLNKKLDDEIGEIEKALSDKKLDPREMKKMLEGLGKEMDDIKLLRDELEELKNRPPRIDEKFVDKKIEAELSRVKSEAAREALRKVGKEIEEVNAYFGKFRSLEGRIGEVEETIKKKVDDDISPAMEQQRKEVERLRRSMASVKEQVDKKFVEAENSLKEDFKDQMKNYRKELEKSAKMLNEMKTTVDTKLLNTEEKIREYVRKLTLWYNDNIFKEKNKKMVDEFEEYKKELEESRKALSEMKRELDIQAIKTEERLLDFIKKESRKELSAEIEGYKKELEGMMKEIEKGVSRTKQVGPELENQRHFLEDMRKTFDLKTINMEEKIEKMVDEEIKKDLKHDLYAHKKNLGEFGRHFHEKKEHMPSHVQEHISSELKKRHASIDNLLKRLEHDERLTDDTRKHFDQEVQKHEDEFRKIEKVFHEHAPVLNEEKILNDVRKSVDAKIHEMVSKPQISQEKIAEEVRKSVDARMREVEEHINSMTTRHTKADLERQIHEQKKILDILESKLGHEQRNISNEVRDQLKNEVGKYKHSMNALEKRLITEDKIMTEESRKAMEVEIRKYRDEVGKIEGKMGLELTKMSKIQQELEPEFERKIHSVDEVKRSLDLRIVSLEQKIEKMFKHDLAIEIEKHRHAVSHIEQKLKQQESEMSEETRKVLRNEIERTKQSLTALMGKYQNQDKEMSDEFRHGLQKEVDQHRRVIADLEKRLDSEVNRVKMMKPPEDVIKEISARYEKGLSTYSDQMKRDIKNDIRSELGKDLEMRATKILTRELEEFANLLDKKMPRFVTRDEFERSWAMIRTPDMGHLMQRIDFLEMKLNEIYTIARNLGTRLPVVVE
jgi:exonuclease SbcC